MPGEIITTQCYAFLLFCRFHFYKLIVAIVLAFLLMQYAVNVFVHHHTLQKTVSPSFSWISSLSLNKVLGIAGGGNDAIRNIPLSSNGTKTSFSINNTKRTVIPILEITNDVAYYTTQNNATLSYASTSTTIAKELELCPLVPPKLVGPLKVMTDAPSYEELEKMYSALEPGGRFHPKECKARHKIAIIIPYRDREEHLRIFLHNIHPILQRQQLDYGIYIIEEAGKMKFNRAMLMNIGYVEAIKQHDYECFIFHDVDLIPEDDRNLYTCPEQPRHMSVAVDTMDYKLPYKDIFGGVSALNRKHFQLLNGFSNEFWGWGGEDDDMASRIKHHGLKISRYSASIARYKMLKHKKDTPNPERYNKLFRGKLRYKTDGLKNLKYKRLDLVLKKLYTWVLVKIKPLR